MAELLSEPSAEKRGNAARVALAVGIYCIFVSLIPIYAKRVFSGGLGVKKFPYPMTAAFLQLGVASFLLCGVNIVSRFCGGSSWILGPHLGFKLKHTALPGVLFGLKYAVTNWSLLLVDAGTHVLLGSTDLVWVLLLARVVNKERPGLLELLAVVLCLAGAVSIALSKAESIHGAALPILANLLPPFVGALCVSTLRRSVERLFDPSNRLQGSLTKVEYTALKLGYSAVAAFVAALVLENGTVQLLGVPPKPFWKALAAYPAKGTGLILASGLLTFVLHVDLAWLAFLTSALAVGLLSQVKVVPQWLLNAAFGLPVKLSALSLVGAALGLLGSVVFAGASWLASSHGKLMLGSGGFWWKPLPPEKPVELPLAGSESFSVSSPGLAASGGLRLAA